MCEDQGTDHNRRKVDSFEHTHTYTYIIYYRCISRSEIIREIRNDSVCVEKCFVL